MRNLFGHCFIFLGGDLIRKIEKRKKKKCFVWGGGAEGAGGQMWQLKLDIGHFGHIYEI